MQVALVKYKLSPKNSFIQVPDEVRQDCFIVVESAKGQFLAEVLSVNADATVSDELTFVRIATEQDIAKQNDLDKKAVDIKNIAIKLAQKYQNDMKIVDAQLTLDGGKVVVSFVCEDRVDFRDLVKELASEIKLRIELRQIGIRDQAKLVGCLGICGKECCCSQYLNDFDKVSIKMAKTQNLSLNPTKISGTCGRLMCCLAYENETYCELGKNCPKLNAKVATPDGDGVVVSNNILKQTCTCRLEKGEDVKLGEYSVLDVKTKKEPNEQK